MFHCILILKTLRRPERHLVDFFDEIKDEAVALVYIVMLLCKTGKYSVMLHGNLSAG